MKIWKDCEMTTFNHDDTPTETIPCEVKLDENKIIVSYKENGIPVLYKGEEISEGHFKLKPEGKNGEASLHKFKEDEYLEGHWHEDTCEERQRGRVYTFHRFGIRGETEGSRLHISQIWNIGIGNVVDFLN